MVNRVKAICQLTVITIAISVVVNGCFPSASADAMLARKAAYYAALEACLQAVMPMYPAERCEPYVDCRTRAAIAYGREYKGRCNRENR